VLLGCPTKRIEDAIYDSQGIRRFVGIDLSRETAQNSTTLLKFRLLLEDNQLTRKVSRRSSHFAAAKCLLMRESTIVDAT
jgi:IS5 family transposase